MTFTHSLANDCSLLLFLSLPLLPPLFLLSPSSTHRHPFCPLYMFVYTNDDDDVFLCHKLFLLPMSILWTLDTFSLLALTSYINTHELDKMSFFVLFHASYCHLYILTYINWLIRWVSFLTLTLISYSLYSPLYLAYIIYSLSLPVLGTSSLYFWHSHSTLQLSRLRQSFGSLEMKKLMILSKSITRAEVP